MVLSSLLLLVVLWWMRSRWSYQALKCGPQMWTTELQMRSESTMQNQPSYHSLHSACCMWKIQDKEAIASWPPVVLLSLLCCSYCLDHCPTAHFSPAFLLSFSTTNITEDLPCVSHSLDPLKNQTWCWSSRSSQSYWWNLVCPQISN